MKTKLAALEEENATTDCQGEKDILQYDKLAAQMGELKSEMRKTVMLPENIVPFLSPGRLLKIKNSKNDWGWGVLINFQKQRLNLKDRKKPVGFSREYSDTGAYILDMGL
jgi:ATP-dependent RNA helicase DOB1